MRLKFIFMCRQMNEYCWQHTVANLYSRRTLKLSKSLILQHFYLCLTLFLTHTQIHSSNKAVVKFSPAWESCIWVLTCLVHATYHETFKVGAWDPWLSALWDHSAHMCLNLPTESLYCSHIHSASPERSTTSNSAAYSSVRMHETVSSVAHLEKMLSQTFI